jgi:hypothetical protein
MSNYFQEAMTDLSYKAKEKGRKLRPLFLIHYAKTVKTPFRGLGQTNK